VEFKTNFKELFSNHLNTNDEWNRSKILVASSFIGTTVSYSSDLQKAIIFFEKTLFDIITNLMDSAMSIELTQNLSSVIDNWKPLEVRSLELPAELVRQVQGVVGLKGQHDMADSGHYHHDCKGLQCPFVRMVVQTIPPFFKKV
jgi:hypothetical protein